MCLLILFLVHFLVLPFEGKLSPELKEQLVVVGPHEKVEIAVHIKEIYPYNDIVDLNVEDKVKAFQNIARISQQPVIDFLAQYPKKINDVKQFWVFNGLTLKATAEIAFALAEREDIWYISVKPDIKIPPITKSNEIPCRTIEWNLQKIMADSCWDKGFIGEDVIIGHIDSGVDTSHPALRGKWLAPYWFDAVNHQPNPYDDHGHGTHTMGIICGGDGFGPFINDIGTAPGVKFTMCKAFNNTGWTWIHECFQKIAEWKAEGVNISIVNNSWGSSSTVSLEYWEDCLTLTNLGIICAFAIGNNGSGSGTAGTPGNFPIVTGVGATDNNDNVAIWSSRGPAPDLVPWNDPNNWYRPDWNLIKPDLAAPGVSVRSCHPGGTYQSWSGTSMSAPHVVGAMAILLQKNPDLTLHDLYNILVSNADEPAAGAPYPNNNFGWGRLNVWRALQNTPPFNIPWIFIRERIITDLPPGGNGNNIIEPGETGAVVVRIENVGDASANNTSVVLESYDNYITVENENYVFGDLSPGDTANNASIPYLILAHDLTPPGHIAHLGLVVHADGDSADFDDTVYFNIQIDSAPPLFAVFEDDFEYGNDVDSFLNYWEISEPWIRIDTHAYSPPYCAYSDTVSPYFKYMTLKCPIDLSPSRHPRLSFNYSYTTNNGLWDYTVLEITTNGGTTWNYLWGIPNSNVPWTFQQMNLDGYSADSVKIRYGIRGTDGLTLWADWWIDNVKFTVETDNEPPYFLFTTAWPDTNFAGPFLIESQITDFYSVDSAYLFYHVNSGQWQQIAMNHIGNDIYSGIIPQQNFNDTISYYLWARDKWYCPNVGTDPIGAPAYGYYSFVIMPAGMEETSTPGLTFFPPSPNPTTDKMSIRFYLARAMPINISIYDICGRKIRTLADGIIKRGEHNLVWERRDDRARKISPGVYFIIIETNKCTNVKKIILLN